MSVLVRAYDETIEGTSLHPAIGQLCRRAADLELPMLGYVDKYDDTVFNRSQIRLVGSELRTLLDGASDEEAAALRELVELVTLVDARPHRYLVFNGD